ncbi:MAG: hypothetical protein OER86_11010, partial [Phycisphaerae bacterium]|nr:hypothetical protein [Phycisphaerae bacterium]
MRLHPRHLLAFWALALTLGLGPIAAAGAAAGSGFGPRAIHHFDFEERKRGNFESMPMDWYRTTGHGFPRYTHIGFDDQVARSGTHSVKLQLNGGSAGLVLSKGRIAVIPGAHYMVSAMARTADLVHSRARLQGGFVNQKGELIATTVRHSVPLGLANRWTAIHVDLPDAPDEAAWLVLKLELVQPHQLADSLLGNHKLLRGDLEASAWFDDITVYQLPQINLRTQEATNLIRQPDQPRLRARVEDLTAGQLSAELAVFDHAGREVDRQSRKLEERQIGQWEWTPRLDRLGWYWAQLRVLLQDHEVGRAETAFLFLPQAADRPNPESQRFLIDAQKLRPADRALLPDMMAGIGRQGVIVSLWESGRTENQLIQLGQTTDPLVGRLLGGGHRVVLGLTEVPRFLA